MFFLVSMKKNISLNVIMVRGLKISARMKHRQMAVIFCEQPISSVPMIWYLIDK